MIVVCRDDFVAASTQCIKACKTVRSKSIAPFRALHDERGKRVALGE
jgi:hypothetical protein